MWDNKRDAAAGAGTKMHYDIECYYNKQDVSNDSIEYQYFKRFVSDFPHLKPYRTEWMVYYEELKISGSIDMIFENPDGTLQIYDWKRCQEIQHETAFGKYAVTTCLSHLPDTNFWHYALQLNVYKMILEHKYGKTVTNLCLVCLHPENSYKTYERIEVPFLENEMKELSKKLGCAERISWVGEVVDVSKYISKTHLMFLRNLLKPKRNLKFKNHSDMPQNLPACLHLTT
jgi:CRISPR/Cas system-associated exonuclease Cas4 (RecB family)